jgi:tellurite resistance protein TehA-like permease
MKPAISSETVVMGTGIVSVSLQLAHRLVLSWLLFGITGLAWVVLGALLIRRLITDRRGLLAEARAAGALSAVAGTAVLASRIESAGPRGIAAAVAILATGLWLMLTPGVLRARALTTTGSSFLLTVALESLAVVAALLSEDVLVTVLALCACAAGIVAYLPVLMHFDRRELLTGAGDQWVAGGALAISALAVAEAGLAAQRSASLHGLVPALHAIAEVIWLLSILWLVVLVGAEIARPRLHYDPRRWATVFPTGMYAASGFVVSRVGAPHAVRGFADVWTWVSLLVWVLAALGTARVLMRSPTG